MGVDIGMVLVMGIVPMVMGLGLVAHMEMEAPVVMGPDMPSLEMEIQL
jgi:hypothetical protein